MFEYKNCNGCGLRSHLLIPQDNGRHLCPPCSEAEDNILCSHCENECDGFYRVDGEIVCEGCHDYDKGFPM